MSTVGAGVSNPALNNNDSNADTASTVAANSGCFQFIDADNEYDDGLALPDSITIVSSAEDDPRHIMPKDELDYASNSVAPGSGGGEIPYSYVHNPPIKFNAIDRKIFIPSEEIHVEIIDYERTVLDHILNPNLYKIQLTHGSFKWVIHKRYKDFNSLHQQLRIFRTSLNFPIPTKIHKERRAITQTIDMADVAAAKAASGQKASKRRKKSALPKFPIKPDALVPFEAIPDRIKQLEEYLYNLLNIGLYRTHKDTVSSARCFVQSFRSKFNVFLDRFFRSFKFIVYRCPG
jgi:phospholipase D1/2